MDVQVVQEGLRTIQVSGEIDLGNVAGFRSALEDAARESPRGFVVDMSQVCYIDSAGLQALIGAYRSILSAGGKLALVIKHPNVKTIMEVTGVDKLPGILIFEDIDSANTAISRA